MNVARALEITSKFSVTESELHFLAERAQYHRNIVEVGSWKGRTARVLADNTPGTVHCVDPWDGICRLYEGATHESNGYNKEFREFQKNLADHIESGKVKYFRGKYEDFWLPNPDMIFIDAVHDYEDVKRDILQSLKMMSSGLLCGHDYWEYWPSVERAVREIFPTTHKVEGAIWYVEL